MGDLREEIKDDMLKRIKDAKGSEMERSVHLFHDFVSALQIEAETKTITKK